MTEDQRTRFYFKKIDDDGRPRPWLTQQDWLILRDTFPRDKIPRISTRVVNGLHAAGLRYLSEAAEFSMGEWLRQPNFGRKSLEELRLNLAAIGLTFAPPSHWCHGCQRERRWYGDYGRLLCDACMTSLRPSPHQPWNEVLF